MDSRATQLTTELQHNPARLINLIEQDLLSNEEIVLGLNKAISISINWFVSNQVMYPASLDLEKIMLKALRIVCTEPRGITLANLVGQLRYTDDIETIELIGEITVHMAEAELFDLVQLQSGYMSIKPLYLCDPKVLIEVADKTQMPPMVVEPMRLTRNTSSAYLSVDVDSLILKKGNHHSGNICLDSLNTFNKVALELDLNMVGDRDGVSKEETQKQKKQRLIEEKRADQEHEYLLRNGNKFYLPHKYDKRGRTYCQGYHTSYQGDEYHKAILNFHSKEIIKGF